MKIRKSIVDGILYPGVKGELEKTIRGLFKPVLSGPAAADGPAAILSPHGYWDRFGTFMAAAFGAVKGLAPDVIVLAGPVHRDFRNAIFLTEYEYFETPLGAVRTDVDAALELKTASGIFEQNDMSHEEEHCLELQLPFIRFLFPDTPVLPLLLGNPQKKLFKLAAAALNRVLRLRYANPLCIITGNASAYLPYEKAVEEGEAFVTALKGGDIDGLLAVYDRSSHSPCGAVAAAFLYSLLPSIRPHILAGPESLLYTGNEQQTAAVSASFFNEG